MSLDTEHILHAGTWTLAIVLPFAASWLATCWIRKSRKTLLTRALLAGLITLVASPRIHERAMEPFTWAIWRCSVCGMSEYQVRFRDHIVYRSHRSVLSGSKQVWAIASKVAHDHDWLYWLAILGNGRGVFVCNLGLGDEWDEYLYCLDKIPSPEIVRRMIVRVARASRDERRALIQVFGSWQVGEPFASMLPGSPPSSPTREEFERDYVAWLDRHPEWK